jgi:uncharacterized protein (DUF427 family)
MTMPPHYPQQITPAGHVEPVARRIRAELGGAGVVDTTAAHYLWTWPFYPRFQIPLADIDTRALTIADDVVELPYGTGRAVTLIATDTPSPPHGHVYVTAEHPALVGTVHLEWNAVDAWYEEEEQVFVHPRSPYVRVDALRSTRHVRIERGGVLLAESHAPVMVFETGLPTRYYLDRSAVDFSHLQPSDTVTACPYKGRTTGYWSVEVAGHLHPDLAWSYDFPTRQLPAIAGLVAFLDERVDVTIDGSEVPRPQTRF